MKKTFTVTAFDAYDYTQECSVCSEYCKTIADAENKIETDDAERYERWRHSMFYNHGKTNPFEHHEYGVIEMVGTAEIDVEDDETEPSYYELLEAVEDWQEGDYFCICKL